MSAKDSEKGSEGEGETEPLVSRHADRALAATTPRGEHQQEGQGNDSW